MNQMLISKSDLDRFFLEELRVLRQPFDKDTYEGTCSRCSSCLFLDWQAAFLKRLALRKIDITA